MRRSVKCISLFLLISLMVSVIFTGCTSSNTNTNVAASTAQSPDQSQSTPASTAVSTAASESTAVDQLDKNANIRFAFWGSPYEKSAVETAIKAFTEKTGVQVTPMHIPTDFETKLTTMIAANDAPDASYLVAPTAYNWYKEGKLSNFNDILASDPTFSRDDYVDGTFVYGDTANDMLGMMFCIESYALFYNKEMFEAAGVETPPTSTDKAWTWDQFLEVAQKLTLDNNGKNALDPNFDAKNIKQYGVYLPLWFGDLEALMIRNDGGYYLKGGDEFSLFKPETADVLQKVADLMNKYHVCPTPTASKNLPASSISLPSKKYAMCLDGQYVLNDFGQVKDFEVGVGVLPTFKNTRAITASALDVIYKTSKYQKESWALIKALTNPENSINVYKDGLWMPVMKSFYTDPEKLSLWASTSKVRPEGYKETFIDAIAKDSVPTAELSTINFNDINNILMPALDQAWAGKKTVEEVLKEVEPKIKPLVVGRYNR